MRETFYLFAGDCYDPAGGWDDYRCRFETLEAAQTFFDARRLKEPAGWDWGQVVLIPETGEPVILAEWDDQYGWEPGPTPEEKTRSALEAKAAWEARQATLLPCGCEPETTLCTQPGGSCGRCVKHCTCTVEFEAPSWAGRQRGGRVQG